MPRGTQSEQPEQTGQDTRQRLIEAGLDAFGRAGFDAASTRAIAAAAGANLAAIKYHFGSKHGLYLAVAGHIAERIRTSTSGLGEEAAKTFAAGPPDRERARAMLVRMAEGALRLLAVEPEGERWARFILREQFEPSEAFELIYSTVMGRMHTMLTRLIAVELDLDPESEDAKLEAFAFLGQVLVFRIARAAVLKRLGWGTIGSAEGERIACVLRRSAGRLSAAKGERA